MWQCYTWKIPEYYRKKSCNCTQNVELLPESILQQTLFLLYCTDLKYPTNEFDLLVKMGNIKFLIKNHKIWKRFC